MQNYSSQRLSVADNNQWYPFGSKSMRNVHSNGSAENAEPDNQDLKMKDLLIGIRRAFVVRYSEHLWKAYTVIRFLHEFYYTKYTKQYILKPYNSSLHATQTKVH